MVIAGAASLAATLLLIMALPPGDRGSGAFSAPEAGVQRPVFPDDLW